MVKRGGGGSKGKVESAIDQSTTSSVKPPPPPSWGLNHLAEPGLQGLIEDQESGSRSHPEKGKVF